MPVEFQKGKCAPEGRLIFKRPSGTQTFGWKHYRQSIAGLFSIRPSGARFRLLRNLRKKTSNQKAVIQGNTKKISPLRKPKRGDRLLLRSVDCYL
jgi:hypothetical protein